MSPWEAVAAPSRVLVLARGATLVAHRWTAQACARAFVWSHLYRAAAAERAV